MRVVLTISLVLSCPGLASGYDKMQTDSSPPADKRFELVRHLNLDYDVSYMATQYRSRREWARRAAELREQVLGAAGLLPMPQKHPLNARIFGKIDHGNYTVEKCYFESYPGFYCTGNLYRPKAPGRHPAVLNTHGHWAPGRLVHNDNTSIPTRAANFAKQGYVVFSYDMVGYNDSRQVRIPHDPTGLPKKHDALGDRRCRLWGISLGGLQTWNSIRAIDFLQSLPDVDPDRIAITGASGGGTQTFLLTAAARRMPVREPAESANRHQQR
ncbi:MAG: alpha/beta hydrolase family protein [Armatimonadota bacterium]